MDLAPHCLDLLRYLCGLVIEVSGMVDSLASDSPVEDTATLLLRLANGAQAVVTTHWSTANFEPDRLNAIELFGTKGTIIAAPINAKDSTGTVRLITADGVKNLSVSPASPRPHVALLETFGKALVTGEPIPVTGEEGLMDLAVIQAAYQSASRGGIVLKGTFQ